MYSSNVGIPKSKPLCLNFKTSIIFPLCDEDQDRSPLVSLQVLIPTPLSLLHASSSLYKSPPFSQVISTVTPRNHVYISSCTFTVPTPHGHLSMTIPTIVYKLEVQ